jgi:NAD-dependent deacetylase
METITLDDNTWLLALTGAGVSAESGIPTFRDANGLWENHRVEDVASPDGFERDPRLVWRFYSERRAAAKPCTPNAGHVALAEVEARMGERFLLATQNIDGLHRRAGSERVVEMHGNLYTSRCAACDAPPFHDEATHLDALPKCARCAARGRDALLRPHIVWFGEALDPRDLDRIDTFLREGARRTLVFLAAGTSGVVYPAAGLVDVARRRGASTWLVNYDAPDNRSRFAHFVQGRSGEVLPGLFRWR